MDNVYVAEVRNIKDPHESGKVQLRIYNQHDNEQQIKDADLPWALPIQPITSAATSKIGTAPVGMVVGSRVFVTYLASDSAKQYPIILGTFARGALAQTPSDIKSQDKGVGHANLDTKTFGIDSAAAANTHKTAPLNPNLGGIVLDLTKAFVTPYGKANVVTNDAGQPAIKMSKTKNAPNASNPTLASAKPGSKLPDALKKVDPKMVGVILKNLFTMLSLVNSIMNCASTQSRTIVINNAFANALCRLASNYSYDHVIMVFDATLEAGGFADIITDYQTTLFEGLSYLIQQILVNGENNIPVTVIPPVVYGPTSPPPDITVDYDLVPDLYVQQYFSSDNDPYPGYIQWVGPLGDIIYSRRLSYQHPWPDQNTALQMIMELELFHAFKPFFQTPIPFPPSTINSILDTINSEHQDNSLDAVLGNNAAANLTNLLTQLLGLVGTALKLAQQTHLPNSVLNQGAVKKSMDKFSKNIALAKAMQQKAATAFKLPSNIANIGPITSIVSSLTQMGVSLPAMNLNLQNGLSVQNIISALVTNPTVLNQFMTTGVSPSDLSVNAVSTSSIDYNALTQTLQSAGVSNNAILSTVSLMRNVFDE